MTDMTARVASARERRSALKQAMEELGAAASSPSAVNGWIDRVAEALDSVSAALDRHVEMVEGVNGLLAEITDVAPHLQPAIDRMPADHQELGVEIESARLAAKETAAGAGDPASLRRRIRSLLSALGDHRDRGADLVYDAYQVDITAAD